VSSPPLTIHLFGPLRVRIHGEPMPRVRTRSVEWLLALLVLRHGRSVDRSWLASTLWPDSEESQALHNLRDILVHLRKALGPEKERLQSPTRDTLTFAFESAQVDLLQFDTAMKTGEEAFHHALEAYTGPLLEGCLEEWVFPERASREQACLHALETLAHTAEQKHDYTLALSLLRRAKSLDPLQDNLQRGLMRVLAVQGEAPAALASYRDHRILLHAEMNLEPDEETIGLFQQIRQQAKQDAQHRDATREEARPLPASSPTTPTRPAALPHPLTALIGREQETRDIASTLSRSRLVTLVGGGGVGKTRLAIQVAQQFTAGSKQTALFVTLAALSDPTQLPAFVVNALGIREEAKPDPAALLRTLAGWISAHSTLLVLDNCEHLVEAAASLTQTLLEHCPNLRILTTSRERLGLTGEAVWRVPSLPVPEIETLPAAPTAALAAALTFPGIQLFVERASSAHREFHLTRREDVEAVCRICRQLDGIPLAIELAAARVRSLAVDAIHRKLDQRFRLLTGGSPAVLPRHQTLRSLVDWSYDLISEAEKALLRRASVFSAGWTLEEAETVCADDSVEEWEVLDLLTSLIDKSLIVAETSHGGGRYHLLETVRQYGRDRLAESGEGETFRTRHRDFFLALAETSKPKLTSAEQAHWLSALEAEHDNLRQALTFCLENPHSGEPGLRLGGALLPFWMMRGHFSEGRDYLTALLALPEAQSRSQARAGALYGAGVLAKLQGDYPTSRALHEACLSIQREGGDQAGIADSLNGLGNVAHDLGDFTAASALHQESLAIQRTSGNRRGIAVSLINLARTAYSQGNFTEAKPLLEESLAIQRELEDKGGIANSLYHLGLVALYQADYGEARTRLNASLAIRRDLAHKQGIADALNALATVDVKQEDLTSARLFQEESLTIQRELGDRWGIAASLANMATIAQEQSDYVGARALYEESLEILVALGDRRSVAELLEAFADLAHREEKHAPAAQLWGAASALRKTVGAPLWLEKQTEIDRAMVAARTALGEAAFRVAWDSGHTMTMEAAVHFALSQGISKHL
jgi:predicted ATPase/DNA-binding SARP family transcriptional activator